MADIQVYKYLEQKKFPIRDNYITFRYDFNKNVKQKFSFLNSHFSILLKKDKKEEIESEIAKRYSLMVKAMKEQKKKEIKLEIKKKVKIFLDKQKLKSVANNKMILDLMTKEKQFINYIYMKQSKNKVIKNSKSSNSLNLKGKTNLKEKRNFSSPFITEIKSINNCSPIKKICKSNNIKIKNKHTFNTNKNIKLRKLLINKSNTCSDFKYINKNNIVNNILSHKNKNYKRNIFIFNDKAESIKNSKSTQRFNSDNYSYNLLKYLKNFNSPNKIK
jgi:hypothetical protein